MYLKVVANLILFLISIVELYIFIGIFLFFLGNPVLFLLLCYFFYKITFCWLPMLKDVKLE